MSKTRTKRRKPERRTMPAAALRTRNVRLTQRPVVQLGRSETGYCMDPDRVDDCLRPALATVLQVPVEQLPDPRLDARVAAGDPHDTIAREGWERFERWLSNRRLRLTFHDDAVALHRRRRWIGVCRPDAAAARALGLELADFADHCLAMAFAEILHDPAVTLRPPPGMRTRSWRPDDVVYGITIDPKE